MKDGGYGSTLALVEEMRRLSIVLLLFLAGGRLDEGRANAAGPTPIAKIPRSYFRHSVDHGNPGFRTQSLSFKGRRLIVDNVFSMRPGGGIDVLVRGLAKGKHYSMKGRFGIESLVTRVPEGDEKVVEKLARKHFEAGGAKVIAVKFNAY